MTSPFFVHTPRNRFGESLAGPSIHQPPFTIQSCLDEARPRKDYASDKNEEALQLVCRRMNNDYNASMMAAYI
jgi:hypothetical protein